MYSLAINKDLTDNHFQNDRRKLKIKTITHTIKLSNNPDSSKYSVGTAFSNTAKIIKTLHSSTKEVFTCDTNGIIVSDKIYPILDNNQIDSSRIKYFLADYISKVINNGNYKYVWTHTRNSTLEKRTYKNGTLSEDSTSDGNFKYIYDKNNQISKVLKDNALLLEYNYSKSKMTIKKYQRYNYKEFDSLQIFYNVNEISNKSKIIKSTFTNLNNPDDLKTEIMFHLDKNGEVKSSKKKISYEKQIETISDYKNIYKDNLLFQVLNKPEVNKKSVFIYTFNKNGFIEKIETDYSTETFAFEYY